MTIEIIEGDCRDVLRELPDQSVNMCVTSPPYFGLRDYGTASWEGGNPTCDHINDNKHQMPGATSQRAGRSNIEAQRNQNFRNVCGKCGAVRVDRQIGLEPTPTEFVEALVGVMREVRRVLRDDGTLWLNLGDSYAGSGRGGNPPDSPHQKQATNRGSRSVDDYHPVGETARVAAKTKFAGEDRNYGFKQKDLIGIPWMVAFALRADGWYLRQDIIWAKPNPMPESVRDRCTKAHEYIFLLSKSPKYFYDADAIAEPAIYAESSGRNKKEAAKGSFNSVRPIGDRLVEAPFRAIRETRNKRSVWTVTPKPFKEAHFATFPPDLIEPCVLAGCPEGGVVLDPFFGAGTTGVVCQKHNRSCIGIELNPAYFDIAVRRLGLDQEVA